jgi:hypothetical protein
MILSLGQKTNICLNAIKKYVKKIQNFISKDVPTYP